MRAVPTFRARYMAASLAALGLLMSAGAASAQANRQRSGTPARATPANGANAVQAGIAAWRDGNYEAAVRDWRPYAEAGDPDAQFNMGQAYRLGRGVEQNTNQAIDWFERAARQRHEQAGTNLGLLLFQTGQAREAMPWLQEAANRGDPRAQYVFGTALFNGDVVQRDMPRSYALMSLAAGQGFPQAADQLRQMEGAMTPQDLEAGRGIARQMGVAAPSQPPVRTAEAAPPPLPRQPEPRQPEPRPGSDAGTSYEVREDRPSRPAPRPAEARPERPRPVQQAEARPAPTRRPAAPAPAPARAAANGPWLVQLGAFADEANARRRWASLRRVGALSNLSVAFVRAGSVTRLRAGSFASRDAAARACTAARSAGSDCIPVPR